MLSKYYTFFFISRTCFEKYNPLKRVTSLICSHSFNFSFFDRCIHFIINLLAWYDLQIIDWLKFVELTFLFDSSFDFSLGPCSIYLHECEKMWSLVKIDRFCLEIDLRRNRGNGRKNVYWMNFGQSTLIFGNKVSYVYMICLWNIEVQMNQTAKTCVTVGRKVSFAN